MGGGGGGRRGGREGVRGKGVRKRVKRMRG